MQKYYTRACNFYYGRKSVEKVLNKSALPLNDNNLISFDSIEIISRKNIKRINVKKINSLKPFLKKKIKKDLKEIIKKKKFKGLNFSDVPLLMGIINLTPDSFSDGGKYNKKNKGFHHAKYLIKKGCKILDIGGESTRPGSNEVEKKKEWKRINITLKKLKKIKKFVSLDTRKSWIIKKAINYKINLINDVSGLSYDSNTINILKDSKIPFVIHHMKGNPKTMQKNPIYKNVLLDIYDFFETKIKKIKLNGIKHENIILDPGIGFGKNLKHNITLMSKISIFHSLGFPIMLGVSRKRFIKDLSGNNDSKERLGGTISSSLYAMMQGVQILRVHDVNEVNQSLKVFKSLKFL
jgi:dihydropteroate synthase|tara:strand:+ start:304 stop:1356 length:1053 start_codon:yes stop_codon:yes gene_type:complete